MLRALCREKKETKEFNDKNSELNHAQRFVGNISNLMNPITYVIINIAIVVLIYVGAIKVEHGVLSQAAVIALYNYMSQILIELIKLANLIITITKAVASGNRIEAILEKQPSIVPKNADERVSSHTVEFKDVDFRYHKDAELSLSKISFFADKGETVGIIGGTGSGKTTLINLLCRFYDATQGCVSIDGYDVRSYDLKVLNDKIGIVPQNVALFRGTIRSNLCFGKKDATDEELWEALELAQAKDFVLQKENQLDFEIEGGGKNLSGGQRQRLTIARALIRKPSILILDDSSSALDFATDLSLRRAINSLDYNPLVFLVSQRASTLKSCYKIIVLDEGVAVGIGNHTELFDTCQEYREICYSQNISR